MNQEIEWEQVKQNLPRLHIKELSEIERLVKAILELRREEINAKDTSNYQRFGGRFNP